MSSHFRRLPHHYPDGKTLFVTWHLHGSLPHGRYPPPHKLSSGQAFGWMDRYLDMARSGPMYLCQEAIAGMVVSSLRRGQELGQYDLHAYVVMANHVRVLLFPHVSPSRLLQSLKGGDGAGGQSVSRSHWGTFLAGRVLRSLGERPAGVGPDQGLHREQSDQSRTG